MKKVILIILGLIFTVSFSCKEKELSKANYACESQKFINMKLTPGLLYGISLGYGKQHLNNSKIESILNIHYNEGTIINNIKVAGIYFQRNVFLNESKNGIFGVINCGIDYAVVRRNSKNNVGFVPNISFGMGYSFPISSKSFIRLDFDIGYKLYFCNLNVSLIF